MGLFDLYEAKMENKINVNSSLIADNITYYNNHFHEDESYRQGSLIKSPNMEIEETDFRIVNVDNSTYEKKIYFRPNTNIKIGEYIKVKDKDEYYLVNEFESNLLSPYATARKCTQILKYKGLSNDIIIPCYIENSSYGSKGELTNVEQESDFDSRGNISVQKNIYTDILFNGFRLIFNKSKNDVYEITKMLTAYSSDYFENSGYYQLICKYVKWVQGDDFENNIAFNPRLENNTPTTNDIYVNGSDVVSLSSNQTYTIVNTTNVTFELDSDTVAENIATIISQNGTSCVIKALVPYMPIAIVVKDSNGNQIAIKSINTIK